MWYEKAWRWAKEELTITVPGVVVAFAATYILMLAVQAGAAGAAWVQAFGSIGAILAATYIANESRRADRERERRREAVICLALLYRVEAAKMMLSALSYELRDSYYTSDEIERSQIDGAIEALNAHIHILRAFDQLLLPDPRLVNALFDLIDQLVEATWIADAIDLSHFIELGKVDGPFSENIERIEGHIELIREFAGL